MHRLACEAFQVGIEVAKKQGLYGAGQDLLKDTFSENVRGSGPAVAEMAFKERTNEPFLLFTADKTGPSAYNLPLYLWFADPMYNAGLISPTVEKEFIFTVMDVEHIEGIKPSYNERDVAHTEGIEISCNETAQPRRPTDAGQGGNRHLFYHNGRLRAALREWAQGPAALLIIILRCAIDGINRAKKVGEAWRLTSLYFGSNSIITLRVAPAVDRQAPRRN